jgi:hypothetical protein
MLPHDLRRHFHFSAEEGRQVQDKAAAVSNLE